jgi:hypothetical protein
MPDPAELRHWADEAERQRAGEALMRWLEGSGGERGETMAATQAEVEEIWFAAWEACRRATLLPEVGPLASADYDEAILRGWWTRAIGREP